MEFTDAEMDLTEEEEEKVINDFKNVFYGIRGAF